MESLQGKRRLIVAITGASGSALAYKLLDTLGKVPDLETHLVVSSGAKITMEHELPGQWEEVRQLANFVHDNDDIGACLASGSFRCSGMVIIPCSMKTVAGIYNGYCENLILRAADVTIKEGRPLILVPRESPLSPIHLRNLHELSKMGVAVIPPMMTFYNHPQSIDDMVFHLVVRIMDRLGFACEGARRWCE